MGTDGFEGLPARGGEEDLIQRELPGGGAGDGEVAAVGWVKAAAEEGDAGLRFRRGGAHGRLVGAAARVGWRRGIVWSDRGFGGAEDFNGAVLLDELGDAVFERV